jgi:hypothetical protein
MAADQPLRVPGDTAMSMLLVDEIDHANERAIIAAVCQQLGCEAVKMPGHVPGTDTAPVDFELVRHGRTILWAEVRQQRCSHARYREWPTRLTKFQAMLTVSKSTGIPVVVFVRWSTGIIGWLDIRAHAYREGPCAFTNKAGQPEAPMCAWFRTDDFRPLAAIVNHNR